MAKGTKDAGKTDFEGILKRLEQIVEDLEGGEKGLEDSLKLYEEGVKLSREGHAILDRAESSVQTLLENGDVKEGIEAEK